jgi:excisionase family DNA binding protein
MVDADHVPPSLHGLVLELIMMQNHRRRTSSEQVSDNQVLQRDPPQWVTVNEAIRRTSIGRTRIYELFAKGVLRSIKIGRKRLVSYASILALGGDSQ